MYTVYLLRCSDGTFYVGIARDVAKRLVEHNTSTKGAKYTKARRPVELVYTERAPNRSAAQVREHALRRLTRAEKEALVQSWQPE